MRDIYNWDEDGFCNFNLVRICSCKKCEEDKIKCIGELYKIKILFKCDFYWFVYRIGCERRVDEVDGVIYFEMGRGYLNFCEVSFIVFF